MSMFEEASLRSMACSESALAIGIAAEHLVCADLIIKGYKAFSSDQTSPYNIVVDMGDRLLRIQVKATCFPKNLNANGRSSRIGYGFHVRRRGKFQDKRLDETHCDLVAFVAMDICKIGYLPVGECGQTFQVMGPGFEFKGKVKRSRIVSIDKMPFSEAVARLP
jgi:hypothetical protein